MTGAGVVSWTVAVGIGLAGFAIVPLAVRDRVAAVSAESAIPTPTTQDRVQDWSADSIWSTAPFRLSRKPPALPFGSAVVDETGAPVSPIDPPGWTLTGIVGGQAPVALFGDVPGFGDGTLTVGVGDSLVGYRIEHVTTDSVVVSSGELRWTLRLGTPWGGRP